MQTKDYTLHICNKSFNYHSLNILRHHQKLGTESNVLSVMGETTKVWKLINIKPKPSGDFLFKKLPK